MAFRVEARIEGLEPLIRSMGSMRKGLRNKVLRAAMRRSASLVNKAAKGAAPVGETGQLKRSLGVKVKVYPSGVVVGVVEPRGGFRVPVPVKGNVARAFAAYAGGARTRYHNPRLIAHLVERGTKQRMTKRGANRGAATPKPFLTPAFTANVERILEIFAEELGKELAKL